MAIETWWYIKRQCGSPRSAISSLGSSRTRVATSGPTSGIHRSLSRQRSRASMACPTAGTVSDPSIAPLENSDASRGCSRSASASGERRRRGWPSAARSSTKSGACCGRSRASGETDSPVSRDRPEEFLAVANAVEHLVPARVRKRERGDLAQDPPRYLVGARPDVWPFRPFRLCDLDADETPHWIVAGGIAQTEVPARHRRALRRGDAEHARSLGAPQPKDRLQRLRFRVERAMALHDADRALRDRHALAAADAAIDA